MLRITNGFDRLSDANLDTRVAGIIASMTGNPHFPSPVPALEVVQTALTNFTYALSKAAEGKKVDIALKNQRRQVLIDLMHELGKYVLFTVKEDQVAAISSGFHTAKLPEPAPPITKPTNLQIQEGLNAGELKVSFKKVANARSYIYEYTAEPLTEESTWKQQLSTTRKATFKNLQSGKKYICRVAAVGVGGQLVYSDPVSRIVQ